MKGYVINGGFQKAQQDTAVLGGITIEVEDVTEASRENNGVTGQHLFTNWAWNTDLASLLKAAAEYVTYRGNPDIAQADGFEYDEESGLAYRIEA